jgi:hypothetical protein
MGLKEKRVFAFRSLFIFLESALSDSNNVIFNPLSIQAGE